MTKRVYRKYKVTYPIDSLDPNPIVKIFDDWYEVDDFIGSLKLKTEHEYSLLQIKEFDDNLNEL
jgi:hypothetical protein